MDIVTIEIFTLFTGYVRTKNFSDKIIKFLGKLTALNSFSCVLKTQY